MAKVRRAVGVDGYAGGWVAVELRSGAFAEAWIGRTLATLLADLPASAIVGVDIPLGLVEHGWRSADREAAARLGVRRASVFAVPPRSIWVASDHAQASRRCRDLTGAGLTIQAWRLGPKILEANAYRATAPHELFEVHPELVFARLAGGPSPRGSPLPYGKKSWDGQCLRRALLDRVGVVLPDDLGEAGSVPVDDVLDAAAAAWCASRIASGHAAHLPDHADQHDERGRPIVIWF